jgi:hypothetical protein
MEPENLGKEWTIFLALSGNTSLFSRASNMGTKALRKMMKNAVNKQNHALLSSGPWTADEVDLVTELPIAEVGFANRPLLVLEFEGVPLLLDSIFLKYKQIGGNMWKKCTLA